MKHDVQMQARFAELEKAMASIRILASSSQIQGRVDGESWQKWATSVLNLLSIAFGQDSVHFQNFKKIHDKFNHHVRTLESARGVFKAAKEDFDGGYVFSLVTAVSGEVFGDFVALAKQSLSDGYKDVAAVLACAALEDALKRFARLNGLTVDDEVMQQVVSALKSKGLVSGAQKTLLDAMPKIRDYAMHANWEKISGADVGSVIGFVEHFLLENF